MRRLAPFMFLFIAAAMLTVLVAWGCILWSPYTSHTAPPEQPTADGYPATISGPYGQQGWWFSAAGLGVWRSVPSGARASEEQFLYYRGSYTPAYYRGGWPILAVESTVTFHDYRARWDLPVAEIFKRGLQTSSLPVWLHAVVERRLPLVPLWFGFAVDTLVYFCVLFGVRLLIMRGLTRTPNRALSFGRKAALRA